MADDGYEIDEGREEMPGIVIQRGADPAPRRHARIEAFIWGGKVRPTPTLPYGRYRGYEGAA